MATVRALANAVEARDAYTGKHAERVAAYALSSPRPRPRPGRRAGDRVRLPAARHRQGRRPRRDPVQARRLTAAGAARDRAAPVIGAQIVRGIDFLGQAAEVIRHHHERLDGTGYPDRLAGEEIPLSARVFAVADVLDALTTTAPTGRARRCPRRGG